MCHVLILLEHVLLLVLAVLLLPLLLCLTHALQRQQQWQLPSDCRRRRRTAGTSS
jgi:hypothetical protein